MKKKLIKYILAGAVLFSTASCKKYLDVNEPNPNTATYSTPELVLPQALTYVAANYTSYHDYGRTIVYIANAGGYGGWGTQFTYDYNNSQFNNLFNSAYDNILDFNYIINNSDPATHTYYIAVSKIAKAYLYLNLVNEYDAVPFTDAAKGTEALTPKYDDAKEIYKSIEALLDEAIAEIKAVDGPMKELSSASVLFNDADDNNAERMEKWIQFANTIKLKLYVFADGKGVFTGKPTFSNEGFLTTDAIVNPGYQKLDGKQNPTWNTYHSSYTQAAQLGYGRQYIPNRYTLTFYDGTNISDEGRGAATYRLWPDVRTNFMGNTPTPDNLPTIAGTLGSEPFYIGTPGATTGGVNTIGTLKGVSMGQPIMLANESYLLQAEAIVKGIITGDAKAAFESGIEASFNYLYKGVDNKVVSEKNPTADAKAYIETNVNSPLVNFDLATSVAQKIQAIVTQKFIAHNNIGGHIAWEDYRRTGYPTIVKGGSSTQTFVSTKTMATTVDQLPGRILYPVLEFTLNEENVPKGVTVFGSYVFWDFRNK